MDTYAANMKAAMEMGVDEGLIKKLSDGSRNPQKYWMLSSKGGEDKIQN